MNLLEYWRPMKYYNSSSGIVKEYPTVEISNTGSVRYLSSKNAIKVSLTASVYPTISFLSNGKRKRFSMHVIMASTFLDAPKEPGKIVDHVNRNIFDYSLPNIRFVSSSTNNKNREHPKNTYSLLIVNRELDLLQKIENYTKRDKRRLSKRYLKNSDIILLTMSSELLEEYNIKGKSLLTELYSDDTKWLQVNDLFELSEFGVLRKNLSHGYFFTYGSRNKSGYYRIVLDGKNYLVHTLMAVHFLNKSKELKSGLVVDHIDTNPSNNRLNNLRVVSQSENMANPITINKRSIKLGCVNLINKEQIYFDSQTSCAKILKVSKAWVCRCLAENKQVVPYLGVFTVVEDNLDDFKLITNINELFS